jgi:hypothetical protein
MLLFRSRRREILAGSLIIWRRVAAKAKVPKRRRVVMDRTFWLQVASLGALAAALADPAIIASAPPGRRLVLLLDNAPSARMRVDGEPLWNRVVAAARRQIDELRPSDRVALIASSPRPRRLDGGRVLPPREIRDRLNEILPALSHTKTDEAWVFSLEIAGSLAFDDPSETAAVLAVSVRPAPQDADTNPNAHWLSVGADARPSNIGICELGSVAVFGRDLKKSAPEVLVQVRSFSSAPARGKVVLETLDPKRPLRNERRVALEAGGVKGVVFRIESSDPPPVRIAWENDKGGDALPEDDSVTAAPRQVGPPRLRIHGEAPHLMHLYRVGRGSFVEDAMSSRACDLEVFVEEVPGTVRTSTAAVLILAPRQAFGPFEVGAEDLERPIPRLGTEDRLTVGIRDRPEGLGFPVARARLLRPTGDWRPLIRDNDGNVLAARFRLRDGRPGFVMAFVPGEGLGWTPNRKFGMVLGTFCLRILREAQGATDPYVLRRAEDIEGLAQEPLPLEWRPGLDPGGKRGAGVLSARTSKPELGAQSVRPFSLSTLLPASSPVRHPLWPYFVALAAALSLWEWASVRRPSIGRRRPAGSPSGGASTAPRRALRT